MLVNVKKDILVMEGYAKTLMSVLMKEDIMDIIVERIQNVSILQALINAIVFLASTEQIRSIVSVSCW
jgi:hypothetical protein